MKATTYGVGELILDAAKRGCKKIVVGLGGSATNDGGTGAAAAVGGAVVSPLVPEAATVAVAVVEPEPEEVTPEELQAQMCIRDRGAAGG